MAGSGPARFGQREGATASARVSFYPESCGTTGMEVTGLDPQTGIEAERAIEERARQYEAAGLEGGIGRLRVRAMTDKLTDRNALTDGQERPAFPLSVQLTVPELILPVVTQLGLVDIPGELDGRPIDPALARELATAARKAGNGSDWHLTVVNEDGQAVQHGCSGRRLTAKHPGTGETVTLDDKTFPLHDVPVYDCTHEHEEPGHDPSAMLRHLVNVRDRECVQPTCRRPARECDFEHGVEYSKGGRTCTCKCDVRSHMLSEYYRLEDRHDVVLVVLLQACAQSLSPSLACVRGSCPCGCGAWGKAGGAPESSGGHG
jgi:hypothetical protein